MYINIYTSTKLKTINIPPIKIMYTNNTNSPVTESTLRVITTIILTIMIGTFISWLMSKNGARFASLYKVPEWYINISLTVFYIIFAFLWIKMSHIADSSAHHVVDFIFGTILIFLLLSTLSLWCMADIKTSIICICLVGILSLLVTLMSFSINNGLGCISLISTAMILYRCAWMFNITKRNLNED